MSTKLRWFLVLNCGGGEDGVVQTPSHTVLTGVLPRAAYIHFLYILHNDQLDYTVADWHQNSFGKKLENIKNA